MATRARAGRGGKRGGGAGERAEKRRPRAPRRRVLLLDAGEAAGALRSAGMSLQGGRTLSGEVAERILEAVAPVVRAHPQVWVLVSNVPDEPPLVEAAPAEPVLSPRERQVLELLARGHTRRDMAVHLDIGVKSVETYRARLAQKLGLRTRADLVRYALESGLLLGPRGR